MRRIPLAIAALTVAGFAMVPGAQAQTEVKCNPDTLSATLYERMGEDGKSDADIREILDSSFKRRMVRGRVADSSGCTADQIDKALESLTARVKQG